MIKMKKYHSAYKIFMSALSIISIYFAIADISNQVNIVNNKYLVSMDIFIWIIFCIDYFYKLYLSEDKINYIKTNKLDALSMIPVPILNIYFSNGFISFLRLFRTLSFLDEIRDNFKIFAKHKGVIYAVYIFCIILFSSSFAIYFVEGGTTVKSIGDAFYWSITTASTCGYGDISPKTTIGKFIAVTLMMTGISVFGVIMSTIGSMITEIENKPLTEDLESGTIDLSGLTNIQIDLIKNIIKEMKK